MHLEHPQALCLLLLLPVLCLLIAVYYARQKAFRDCLGDANTLRQTPFRFPCLQRRWVRTLLLLVPFICFVVALADPHLPRGPFRLPAGVLEVVMLIDVSKSMMAEDYSQKSRLDKARELARQFLSELPGNRVGLVTFSGNSFRQAEVTEDLRPLDFILEHWVAEESAGVSGSNLSQALQTGMALLSVNANRKQVMVIFSDGGDAGEALDPVLTTVTHRGIQTIVYGLGQQLPSRIPRYDKAGKFRGYLEQDSHTVTTQLNEAPLKQIASHTNGQYVHVTHTTPHTARLISSTVLRDLASQDTQKIFQPFLFAGLLVCGFDLLVKRL